MEVTASLVHQGAQLTCLPTPEPGRSSAEAYVGQHLAHLLCDQPVSRSEFAGGQTAADTALKSFSVTGYASDRNQVWPPDGRGASRLSPYIRHGLLTLPRVWAEAGTGPERDPERDLAKFRDELLWQEYARHLYARLGSRTGSPLRARLDDRPLQGPVDDAWVSQLPCVAANVNELTETGWLVNQARMWLSSHWAVRHHRRWRDGEEFFFRHLLDGSRAANRLGWQWTTGVGSHKPYAFSRWQVEKRAPGWCQSCAFADRCPIQDKPSEPRRVSITKPYGLGTDTDLAATAGPATPTVVSGDPTGAQTPDVVWLTAESLGTADAALEAHRDLPVVFIYDEPLLARLRLSAKRLIFLTETLAEIGVDRRLDIHLGDPVEVLRQRRPAVTFAPVPGFRSRVARLPWVEMHPWPWLVAPHSGSLQSFSAWRKGAGR